jgi:hypothetical protein
MRVFLETRRLVLRRFTVADADDLESLDADPEVMRFVTGDQFGDVEYALDKAGWQHDQAGAPSCPPA